MHHAVVQHSRHLVVHLKTHVASPLLPPRRAENSRCRLKTTARLKPGYSCTQGEPNTRSIRVRLCERGYALPF